MRDSIDVCMKTSHGTRGMLVNIKAHKHEYISTFFFLKLKLCIFYIEILTYNFSHTIMIKSFENYV